MSDRPAGEAPVLCTEERQVPSAAWNATFADFPLDRCVHELVADQAQARPDAPAVVAEDGTLSYGELDRRATALAEHLRALGTPVRGRVAVCLDRSLEFVVAALGVLKAGAAYVPLDPASPPQRLAGMLLDAEVSVVVTHSRTAASVPPGPWHMLVLDATPGRESTKRFAPAPRRVAADDDAYIVFTSGSSGTPKGVRLSHANLLNLVYWHRQAFGVSVADRASQVAGVSFDAAVWEVWPYLAAGASVHIPGEAARTSPAALRDWLLAERITISFVPTALAELVLGLDWPASTSLRLLLTGADRLHRFAPHRLPFALVNNYGPTETTVVATSGRVPTEAAGGDGLPTIGRPIANARVYVLDAAMVPVHVGEPGELYVGGAGVARGYLGQPQLTAERFVHDPFATEAGARLYRTGDLVRWLSNGELDFIGRLDEQVKIRGYRVELGEIEAVLARHPGVQSAVVTAPLGHDHTPRLVGYVVSRTGVTFDAARLGEHLARHLPPYMLPHRLFELPAFPVTLHGKVDREALLMATPPSVSDASDEDAPEPGPRQLVASIVAEVLGLERVGIHDNFFELGGHSLLGAQLITRLQETFGVELLLRSVFESPTVADLADEVELSLLARLELMTEAEVERLLA